MTGSVGEGDWRTAGGLVSLFPALSGERFFLAYRWVKSRSCFLSLPLELLTLAQFEQVITALMASNNKARSERTEPDFRRPVFRAQRNHHCLTI